MAKPQKPLFLRWLILLPVPALWCVASVFGWLDFIEERSTDWRFWFRGERDAPVKVAYVDIDAKSIADLGNMPWDRGYYAEVCTALLSDGKTRAIGIDLVFSEKGQPELADKVRVREGNRKLAQFLFDAPPVVVAATYAASQDRDINGQPFVRELPRAANPAHAAQPPELPEFRMGNVVWNPPTIGLIDTIDGGTREVPLFARTAERTYFHMAVELARLWWGLPREAVQIRADSLEFVRPDGSLQARIPLIDGQDVQVNWFSRWHSPRNPRASFSDVLAYARMLKSANDDEAEAARDFFAAWEGAVVLIGPVDPLLQDLASTPFDEVPVPRVGIHGNLLKTIVSGEYLRHLSREVEIALVFILTGFACILAVIGGRFGAALKAASVLLLAGYAGLVFVFFKQGNIILPLAAPLGAAFTTSFAGVIWRLVLEERQKSRLKGMFGTYVSPQLVNRLVESGEDPKLGGAEVEVTAFFSDIQDFSVFAEQLSPAQLVELMNEYLTACTDIITAEGGTLDKYIGDAVVAMFGAPVALPDHAYRACIASQRIQQRLGALRQKWISESGKWPVVVGNMHTRVGLNSGPAVVGNMGSHTRFNYTMMGDNVNLAARLEGAAKSYGAGILLTDATKRAAEAAGDRCVFRFIDRIVVRGRLQPVAIYELLGLKESVSPALLECAAKFDAAMQRYLQRDWTGARNLFEKSAELEPAADAVGGINPSLVFKKRCDAMRENPPASNWDGVYVMATK